MAFEDLLKQFAEAQQEQEQQERASDPKQLKELFQKLQQRYHFRPGDLVTWKPGLQNRMPHGPYVVVEVLKEPVFDNEKESSSPYFREPLDLVLGHSAPNRDKETSLICHHYDSRRFQPYISVNKEEPEKVVPLQRNKKD